MFTELTHGFTPSFSYDSFARGYLDRILLVNFLTRKELVKLPYFFSDAFFGFLRFFSPLRSFFDRFLLELTRMNFLDV